MQLRHLLNQHQYCRIFFHHHFQVTFTFNMFINIYLFSFLIGPFLINWVQLLVIFIYINTTNYIYISFVLHEWFSYSISKKFVWNVVQLHMYGSQYKVYV